MFFISYGSTINSTNDFYNRKGHNICFKTMLQGCISSQALEAMAN